MLNRRTFLHALTACLLWWKATPAAAQTGKPFFAISKWTSEGVRYWDGTAWTPDMGRALLFDKRSESDAVILAREWNKSRGQ